MSRSSKHLTLAAALVVALGLVLGQVARAAVPTLYANYATNCTFAFVNDSSTSFTSLAPGSYQIVVDTPFAFGNGNALCEFVQFHLTGPGVDFATDLGGGDVEYEQHTVTLQPGATYTVQDDGRAGQTRRTFTVATSGTPTAPATPATSTTTTANPKGTPSKDPIGSAIGPFRGALQAAVSKTGKVTLKKGKLSVSSLKYGRYTIGSPTAPTRPGSRFKGSRARRRSCRPRSSRASARSRST